MTVDLSVYLVTDTTQIVHGGHGTGHGVTNVADVVDVVAAAVAGGVTAVQVRDKHADAGAFLALVQALSARLPAHVALFVNDRIDVFCAARLRGTRVTGVHIGQTDLPAEVVRELVGTDAVIGLSASTTDQLATAQTSAAGIGYVGIGAVRHTSSKPDAPPAIGVDGVADLARCCGLPAVAIGGIVPDDLPALRGAGLAGAAVISWVCRSPNPRNAAAELAAAWKEAA